MGEMMKRISVVGDTGQRQSMLGLAAPMQPRSSGLQPLPRQPLRSSGVMSQPLPMQPMRSSTMQPPRSSGLNFGAQRPSGLNLGAIDELIADSQQDDDSPRSQNLLNRDVATQLRREAEQSDANVDRYMTLVEQSMNIVSEVKSALYDADDAAQDAGAEVLLEEVRDMLTNVAQTTLGEAVQLQKTSENWLGARKKMVRQLKINHDGLELAIQRRAETARESNAESRADCDRLWRQIQDLEKEVDGLPKFQRRGSITDGDDPLSPLSDNASSFSAPTAGGLTLEGAHSLLRAFNAVLRPYTSEIIPQRAELRSSSEAIAQEFLNACNESMKQVNSPPPPSNQRDRVATADGLLSLGIEDSSEVTRMNSGLLQEEQRMLFSKVGQSY